LPTRKLRRRFWWRSAADKTGRDGGAEEAAWLMGFLSLRELLDFVTLQAIWPDALSRQVPRQRWECLVL